VVDQAKEANVDVAVLFEKWLDRTVEIHLTELTKQDIGETDDLRRSVTKHFRRMSEGYLEGGLIFLERGRFVDMGSGRGVSFGRSTRGFDLETIKSGRKPKRWYSKVFYGRLNDLQGALGLKLMEQVVEQGREGLLR